MVEYRPGPEAFLDIAQLQQDFGRFGHATSFNPRGTGRLTRVAVSIKSAGCTEIRRHWQTLFELASQKSSMKLIKVVEAVRILVSSAPFSAGRPGHFKPWKTAYTSKRDLMKL